MRGSRTSSLGNFSYRVSIYQESIFKVHENHPSSKSLPEQAFCSDCAALPDCHYGKMAWPQLDAFKEQLKKYQARTGKTQAQVAGDLHTTYGTLRFWLSGVRPPKQENLQMAAKVFGCSILEFIDDPGNNPDWVEPVAWKEASELDRFILNKIFKDIRQMPEEEKFTYLNIWKSVMESRIHAKTSKILKS